MGKRVSLVVALVLLVLCCAPVTGAERPIVKISVLESGQLLVDGQPSDMERLKTALKRAKDANGAVWYYRENGQQEAPPRAIQVIQLVIDSGVPVSMSSKPDFSDYIDGQGLSHPRQ